MHGRTSNNYLASGKIRFIRFFILSLFAVLLSILLAYGLHQAYVIGFYYFVITPLLIASPLIFVLYYTVKFGHCRNPVAGFCLGLVCALTFYFGHFHFNFISQAGIEYVLNIDFLPKYINFQFENAVIESTPGAPTTKSEGDYYFSWFFFFLELWLMYEALIKLPYLASKEVYCEECKQWSENKFASFFSGSGKAIIEGIDSKNMDALSGICTIEIVGNQPYTGLSVSYCPQARESEACRSYVAVKEITRVNGFGKINKFLGAPGELLLNNMEVEKDFFSQLLEKVKRISD
jgi:hypothetical protein